MTVTDFEFCEIQDSPEFINLLHEEMMIEFRGYMQHGMSETAFNMFRDMLNQNRELREQLSNLRRNFKNQTQTIRHYQESAKILESLLLLHRNGVLSTEELLSKLGE